MDGIIDAFRIMLIDRGHNISREESRSVVKVEIHNADIILDRVEVPGELRLSTFCLYLTVTRVTQETVHKILSMLKDTTVLVLMHQEEEDDTIKHVPSKDSSRVFTRMEILRRPLRVPQVPRMRTATNEELQDLQHHHVDVNKLPRIQMRDFMRRWYGFVEGDAIVSESRLGKHMRVVMEDV